MTSGARPRYKAVECQAAIQSGVGPEIREACYAGINFDERICYGGRTCSAKQLLSSGLLQRGCLE